MFNSIKTDLLLYLLIGKQNSQTANQDDQMITNKKSKRDCIGSYESTEYVEAHLLLEYSVDSHEATGSPDGEDMLLCFISPLSYKRLQVKETGRGISCFIILL